MGDGTNSIKRKPNCEHNPSVHIRIFLHFRHWYTICIYNLHVGMLLFLLQREKLGREVHYNPNHCELTLNLQMQLLMLPLSSLLQNHKTFFSFLHALTPCRAQLLK